MVSVIIVTRVSYNLHDVCGICVMTSQRERERVIEHETPIMFSDSD